MVRSSPLTPSRATLRLMLQACTFNAIKLQTFFSLRVRKSVPPTYALFVPERCSTEQRRKVM